MQSLLSPPFPVVFQPRLTHPSFFPLYVASEGEAARMMYILLIVSFTAQRRARHLIDSSLVLGGKVAWAPSITVIIIHHVGAGGKKTSTGSKWRGERPWPPFPTSYPLTSVFFRFSPFCLFLIHSLLSSGTSLASTKSIINS